MTTTLTPVAVRRLALDTPIGRLVLEGTDDALTRLLLPNAAASARPAPTRIDDLDGPVAIAAGQLTEYFAGTRTTSRSRSPSTAPPSRPTSGGSSGRFRTPRRSPTASSPSSSGIPRLAGRRPGQRRQPDPDRRPCHRVLASGQRIGGYGGGLETKQKLLTLEGVLLA